VLTDERARDDAGGGFGLQPGFAHPEYSGCLGLSRVGQLVLAAETRQLAPVPVGLINGTTYRGGTQPSLEPRRVLAALRQLLEDPQARDQEVINIVGAPYSVTGCTVTGDIAAPGCIPPVV
jgi:hypothetical protein